MDAPVERNAHGPSERTLSLCIAVILTLASTALMLGFASPDFLCDEADYANAGLANSWRVLWSTADYRRHGHGPMAIYLVKLGQQLLPANALSLENRLRFFPALVGSIGIGLLYLILRHVFRTSRAAALVGSGMLLFSVIRLGETNVIGPHHLMLVCTLAIAGVGYHYKSSATLRAGVTMGFILGFGALAMTYVIPAALCWFLAVGLAGSGWWGVGRRSFRFPWAMAAVPVVASAVTLVLWPPGVVQHVILSNFRWYMHYAHATTIVGGLIVDHAPRSAYLAWFARLDAPVLVVSVGIIAASVWKAIRARHLSSKHVYLGIFLAFFLSTALSAHVAGARNLLQFIGVLCLATSAVYDEAVGSAPRRVQTSASVVLVFCALNLLWLSHSSSYIPFLATNGYKAFLQENRSRLRENAKAMMFNTWAFNLYAKNGAAAVNWDVAEMDWTPSADAALPADVKYVLIPGFVYEDMPAEQPMRRIVADHWNLVWEHKEGHAWGLRLYENPRFVGSASPD